MEDERKHFSRHLARDEVRERGRDFYSLSPSFVVSSYVRKRASDKAKKERELREKSGNSKGNVDGTEEKEEMRRKEARRK